MTGKWTVAGVPHRGWFCVGVQDLGPGVFETWEMCEVADVRYVHVMRHPEYPDSLAVGCVCAGHMAGDVAGARRRERLAMNRTRGTPPG